MLSMQQLISWCSHSTTHLALACSACTHCAPAPVNITFGLSFIQLQAKNIAYCSNAIHIATHTSHTDVYPRTGAHRSGDHALAGDGGSRARAARCIVLCTTSWHALSAARSNHRVRRWRSPGAGAPGRHMQELCQWTQPV